jgi:outer membrane immunogenic protein
MKIISRAVLASAALCAVFGQAVNAADDLGPTNPPPLAPPVLAPIYSWTGLYMGINAGYGAARLMESASLGASSLSASENGKGLIAGGQIGYNYQFGIFVVGFEVDEQWANQSNTYNLFGHGDRQDRRIRHSSGARRHSNRSRATLPDGRWDVCRP